MRKGFHGFCLLALFLAVSCGQKLGTTSIDEPVKPPPYVPPKCDVSYRSLGDVFTAAGCSASYSGSVCGNQPVERRGNSCKDSSTLIVRYTEMTAGVPAKVFDCAPSLKEHEVDCNNVCGASGGMGGICLTISVNCFGENVPAGYCSCDL